MAIVYLAHDPNMNRAVAVKVLPRQFTMDAEFLLRFRREVQVIAALEHPSIVPVYDSGEQEGQPFIVMRYLSGGSLSQRLRAQPMPLTELTQIIKQIADALDEVHSQGVIHRDIKPSNILFDRRGNAFLSDFGIAKVAEGSAGLTGMAVIGTPEFMSPEQAMGDQPIDGRSDIYSLGVVLFYGLTRELPFHSNTPMGTALAHITQPIPSLIESHFNLPKGCQAIIQKALAKDPAQRFNTASELAAALATIIPHKLAVATPALLPSVDNTVLMLKRGANVALATIAPQLDQVAIGLGWETQPDVTFDLDTSAFMVQAQGRVPADDHFIFYNNLTSPDGTVRHQGDNRQGGEAGDCEVIHVDLQRVAADIQKIIFTVTIYQAKERRQNFGQVKHAYIRLINLVNQQEVARYNLTEKFGPETAMIFGEIYRYKGQWKFRAVGQGFEGGLRALTDMFGVQTD
jgi:serine/threonine-protein kinase